MKHLYLDDIRTPTDPKWEIVRNYDEFEAYLVKHFTRGGGIAPVPVEVNLVVSFDHDLADEHYVPQELWHDYPASVRYQDLNLRDCVEKTGLECAKLLATYNLIPVVCNCHSWNPVGKANIVGFIDGWLRFNNIHDRRCSYDNIPFTSNAE